MPLAIALFVDQFPALTETFVTGEAQALRRAGHQVHIEAEVHAPDPDPAAALGLDVAWIEDDDARTRVAALVWLVTRHPWRCVSDLASRRRWAREESPQPLRRIAPAVRRVEGAGSGHVHAHFAAGAALDGLRVAALLGLPFSVATHGHDIYRRPRNLQEKHARAAFAVTPCEDSERHLRGVLGPEVGARVHRIVVGVDPDRFRRSRPHPDGRSLVAVARLVEKKGLVHLLDAVAELRERGRPLDRVTIAGQGPLREGLEAHAAALGLQDVVEFAGSTPPESVRRLLEDASLLVAPSVVAEDGDRDTMPVVVKEALAMEIPVVASDLGGLPEIVRPEWGAVTPPGDPSALAEAIDRILSLPLPARIAMGRRGRAFVVAHASLGDGARRLAELVGGVSRAGDRRPLDSAR